MNPKMEKIVERTATSNMTPTMASRTMAIVRPINDLQDGSRATMEAAPGDLPLDVSQIQSRSQTFATGRR
jgi:hypothetical protein